MKETGRLTKSIILVMWTLLLTSFTFILGSVPLSGLYRLVGRGYYTALLMILIGTLYLVDVYSLAIAVLSLGLLVGLFNEIRRNGYSYLASGCLSVTFVATSIYASAFMYSRASGIKWVPYVENYFKENVTKFLPPSTELGLNFDVKQVVVQLPSIGVILLITSLFCAMLFERKMLLWLQIPTLQRYKLRDFKLPDSVIWFFIVSLLLAFIKLDLSWVNSVGMNLLNVVVLLYFFQGLAVIATYFHLTKVSLFWRTLIYVLAVVQLFLAVSLFGIIDYWWDFRKRLINKMSEVKNL